jgi:hypothetical protein
MGIQWSSCLMRARQRGVAAIAETFRPLIPSLRTPITVSIDVFGSRDGLWQSLEVVAFKQAPARFAVPPESVRVIAAELSVDPSVSSTLVEDPNLALAILASQLNGAAYYVKCSDGTGISAFVTFHQGALAGFEIATAFGVSDPVSQGLTRVWQRTASVEDLFSAFYEDDHSTCIRIPLLKNRVPIPPDSEGKLEQ